jgi:preprotein translocase subunit SecF
MFHLKINFMKLNSILLILAVFLFSGISAQVVSKDSFNVLNNEKEALKIAKSINERKIKLAKLENEIAEKTSDLQKTAEESQQAAKANQDAANELSGDDQDKKKAKAAKKAANHAEQSAKQARKAQDKLNDLNKDIESLRKQILEDEQKLAGMDSKLSTGQNN